MKTFPFRWDSFNRPFSVCGCGWQYISINLISHLCVCNWLDQSAMDQYETLEKIGEGAYGKVYKARDKTNGQVEWAKSFSGKQSIYHMRAVDSGVGKTLESGKTGYRTVERANRRKDKNWNSIWNSFEIRLKFDKVRVRSSSIWFDSIHLQIRPWNSPNLNELQIFFGVRRISNFKHKIRRTLWHSV